ncbi:MAG: lipoprotein required for motility [Campylobacter sp.]|nr:lipoprotein required for motility [Campylobacter sp.]
MKKFFMIFLTFFAFLGCSYNGFSAAAPNKTVVVQKIDKDDIREVMRQEKMIYEIDSAPVHFSATGEGLAPENAISYSQAVTLAKRAAIADAQAQLAGQLYGVKVNAQDTVRDAMLRNSNITTKIRGLIKNARVVHESFKNGLYVVDMSLEVSKKTWEEVFSY